jgi:hypothetical protein
MLESHPQRNLGGDGIKMTTLYIILSIIVVLILLFFAKLFLGYIADPTITGSLLFKKILKNEGIYNTNKIPEIFIEHIVSQQLVIAKMRSTKRSVMLDYFVNGIEEQAAMYAIILKEIENRSIDEKDKNNQFYIDELRRFKVI